MSINDRIGYLIDSLDISQKDFSLRINLKPNTLSMIKSGKRNVTERTITDICREFNVSEEWLRNGKGDPFIPISEDAQLSYWLGKLNSSDNKMVKDLLPKMLELGEDELKILYDLVLLLNKKTDAN
jgi:transcriptional regulator with XRE-family HTH domain|nr:MAG TPA: helix-turn-helix domain protein [Caudoviricetes sp.]